VFSIWLVLAGLGRFLIEFFRLDKHHVGDSWLSFTLIATILMMLVGLIMLAFQYGKLKLPLPSIPEKYEVVK
jgi:prolipoprotein diacylglyceryltransferase